MRLWPYDPAQLGAITVFQNSDCSALAGLFYASSQPLEKVYYSYDDLISHGVVDNAISSVMIPFGYQADFYDGDGFSGSKVHVRGNFFEDQTLLNTCVNLTTFDNKTSSIVVWKTNQLGVANGYWRSLFQSASPDFIVHYGLQLTNAEATAQNI